MAQVFSEINPDVKVTWSHRDGDVVAKGTIFGVVEGSARSILVAERIALNFLQRMSGIATATYDMVKATEVRHFRGL
jgi:nicotinate-nucleotide pyrophosphorylase (carboxylating)